MTKAPNILYVHIGRTTFVRKDIGILEGAFSLIEYAFSMKKKSALPWMFVHQAFFLLKNIWSAQLIVSQFAGYHSFLPALFGRILGKPVLIVAAGTESASYPSINYGNFRKRMYGTFTGWSLRLCNHIAPVHQSLIRGENHYYPNDGIKQGMFEHVSGLNKPYTVIPYGFDPDRWPKPSIEKEAASFITVATIPDHMRFVLKGVDLIVEAAQELKECQFRVVGMQYEYPHSVPPNVELLGFVPNEQLSDWLNKAQYFLQLSISEGHPNALCEGMMCECIPIGSAVTSIPDIIGETGYILRKRSAEDLVKLIRLAQGPQGISSGVAARDRTIELFPYTRRQEGLIQLCQELIGTKS